MHRPLAPALWAFLVLPAVLALAGCQKPSFDERYDAAEKAVREKADAIDRDLAERERALASGAAAPAPSPAPSIR